MAKKCDGFGMFGVVVTLIMFGAVGVIAIAGVLLGRLRDRYQGQRWMDGLGSAIIMSFILLGIDAGFSRRCMPNLDLGIMLGQIELAVIFGAPLIPILLFPAFAVAGLLGPQPGRLGASLLVACMIGVALVPGVVWHDVRSCRDLAAILCTSAAIGFLYARFARMRRFGVPIGIAVGITAGVAIFATLPFGVANCYP
jgi:hypothetical protein